MKIKIVEILIVIAILFLVAFVVGCKNGTGETESIDFVIIPNQVNTLWINRNENNEYDLPPNIVYFRDENGKIIEYIPRPNELELVEPNKPSEEITVSFQEQLIKSPADWIERYGDGLESQQTANIVIAIQVINKQGEAIKQLDKRLAAIEVPKEPIVIIDPNEAKR